MLTWLCTQCLDNIEAAQRQNRLFAALKHGNEAMKQLQKEVTLDDVDSLMSDTAESQAYQARPVPLLCCFDFLSSSTEPQEAFNSVAAARS